MSRKNFLIFGTAGLFLICAVIFLTSLYQTTRAEILRMQTETQRLELETAELKKYFAKAGNAEKFFELNEENFISVREFLPATFEQEKFTDSIYRAANKNNISISALQIEEPLQLEVSENFAGNFFKQSIRVQFAAEYVQLLNFLREVLDGKRFATLGKISISAEDEILNCDAEFFIYTAKLVTNIE